MSTDDGPIPDVGSALVIVLGALVLSSAITWTLVERTHVVVRTTGAQIESVRRRAAVEGAVLAATATGSCTTTSWKIDEWTVEVICAPAGTGVPADDGADVVVRTERYTGVDEEGREVVEVAVRRDAAGHVVGLEWEPDGVGRG